MIQSIHDMHKTLAEGLNVFSPIALHLNREQFFVEEEPFDQKLKTSRMLDRFKRSGIQSISFRKGMSEKELESLLEIYAEL